MRTGGKNCRRRICPGGCSARTLPPRVCEDELHVGDRFRIGSATVIVRQPRMPCYKLAVKFQMDDILDRFLVSGLSGFYFSVEQEGEVGVGDSFELLSRNHDSV